MEHIVHVICMCVYICGCVCGCVYAVYIFDYPCLEFVCIHCCGVR